MQTPMPQVDYRDSHKDPSKGEGYDVRAHHGRHRSLVWAWEQERLREVLDRFAEGREIHLLDFACGTGRIIGHLEGRVASATGVDVSKSMLDVARRRVQQGEILEADLTRDDALAGRRFNLITAFRFFLNAQSTLRQDAMAALAAHLADDGFLVFNNHLQRWSLAHLALAAWCRVRGRPFERQTMSMDEVRALVAQAGLCIVGTHYWGVIPATDNRMPLPGRLLVRIEDWLSRWRVFHPLAQNVVVICAPTRPAPQAARSDPPTVREHQPS